MFAAIPLYWYVAHLFNDPVAVFCREAIEDLPAVIPRRMFIDVVDENLDSLVETARMEVERELANALSLYSFSQRIYPRYDIVMDDSLPDDHVMDLRVYQDVGIPARRIDQAVGRMCGNVVFVQYSDDVEILKLRFIHELGHFFGLCHEEGTFMRTTFLRPDPGSD